MPAAQGKEHLYKLFGAIAVFAVLGVVGLLAAPALIDWNAYRDALEDTLSQATGLAVDIEGDLDIAFLPSPRVNARDVTWAGVDGQQPSVQIPEVRAAVALSDLIGGDLRVTDVTLAGPRAVLVLDGSGRPMLAGLGADGDGAGESDPAEPPAFHLDRVEIREGTLSVVRQGRPDSVIVVDGLSGVITTSGTTGRVRVKGAGLVDGVPLDYSASVGRIRPDKPVPLRWTLGLPASGLSVSFQGGVEGAMPDAAAAGRMEIEAERLGVLSEAVGLPLAVPTDGSAKLVADVRLSADRLALDEVKLTANGASATGALQLALGSHPRAAIEIDFSRIDMDRFAEGERIDVAVGLALFLEGLVEVRPADLLDDVALQLRATADAMKVGGSVVHDAALSVDLENGTLFIEQAEVLLPGGSEFSLNGVLEPRQESLSFEGGLAITSDNLRALMDWVGVDAGRVPPARLRALELRGTLRSGPGSLSLDGLSAQIDATRASGRLALGLGPKPRFDIDLAVDTFSLDAYRLRDRQPSESRPQAGDRPDPVGILASAVGDVRLQFDRLTVLGQPLERVELAGTVSTDSIDIHSVAVADYAGESRPQAGDRPSTS